MAQAPNGQSQLVICGIWSSSGRCLRFQCTSTNAITAPRTTATTPRRPCEAERGDDHVAVVGLGRRLVHQRDNDRRWILEGGEEPHGLQSTAARPWSPRSRRSSATPGISRRLRTTPARSSGGSSTASAARLPALLVTNEISASTLGIWAPISTTNGACLTPRSRADSCSASEAGASARSARSTRARAIRPPCC